MRQARPSWRVIALSLLRAIGSVVAFVTIYYLLPLDSSARWAAITILLVGLIVLIALIGYSVRLILKSPFPGLRAVEALAVAVPLFLVLFAGAYAVMDRIAPASFTQTLTHTDALYFTVSVFSTVGFGDITARTDAARIVVTVQMIMDLVVIGVAIQAIVGAARHARARQSEKPLLWSLPRRQSDRGLKVTAGVVFDEQSATGRQGIALCTAFFVLDWTVKCSRVTATIDGEPHEVPWGRHFFPLEPGRHQLLVSYKHLPLRQAGKASIHVDVATNKVVDVSYHAPNSVLVAFLPGKLTVT